MHQQSRKLIAGRDQVCEGSVDSILADCFQLDVSTVSTVFSPKISRLLWVFGEHSKSEKCNHAHRNLWSRSGGRKTNESVVTREPQTCRQLVDTHEELVNK